MADPKKFTVVWPEDDPESIVKPPPPHCVPCKGLGEVMSGGFCYKCLVCDGDGICSDFKRKTALMA